MVHYPVGSSHQRVGTWWQGMDMVRNNAQVGRGI